MEIFCLSPCNGNPSNRSVEVDLPEYFKARLQETLQFPFTEIPATDGDSSQEGASRRNISIDFTKDYRYPEDLAAMMFDFTRSPRDTEELQKGSQYPILEGLQSVKAHVDQQLFNLKAESGSAFPKEENGQGEISNGNIREIREQLGGNRTLSEITEEASEANIDNRSSVQPLVHPLILAETSKDFETSSELDSHRCQLKPLLDQEGYLLLQINKTPARESGNYGHSMQGLNQETDSPANVPHLTRPEMWNGIQIHRQHSFWNSASASASMLLSDMPTKDKHCSSPNFSDSRLQSYLNVHSLE